MQSFLQGAGGKQQVKKQTNHKTSKDNKPSNGNNRLKLSVGGNKLGCGERNYLEKTEINKHITYISGVE